MNTAAALTALADRTVAALPSGHTGAGDPLRKCAKIVNGHKVECLVIGWGDLAPVFEVDCSTEPLTLADAVLKVLA